MPCVSILSLFFLPLQVDWISISSQDAFYGRYQGLLGESGRRGERPPMLMPGENASCLRKALGVQGKNGMQTQVRRLTRLDGFQSHSFHSCQILSLCTSLQLGLG
ncbi:hypothetical protein F5Y02DRAFT_202650 [Annulohypoxylon stygium]|nr:hypothetical protein F5Y02DRAFT_202650 [Annulohypoxylon stygium]